VGWEVKACPSGRNFPSAFRWSRNVKQRVAMAAHGYASGGGDSEAPKVV